MEVNDGKSIFMQEYKQFQIDRDKGEKYMHDNYNDEDSYYCTIGQNKMLRASSKILIYDHFMKLFPKIFE